MVLLPPELRVLLPAIGETQGLPLEKRLVVAKYFLPNSPFRWYVVEGGPVKGAEEDFKFYGLISGIDQAMGYFKLSLLQQIRSPNDLPVERDLYIAPGLFHLGRYLRPDFLRRAKSA